MTTLTTYLGSVDFFTSAGNAVSFAYNLDFDDFMFFVLCRFSVVVAGVVVPVSRFGDAGGVYSLAAGTIVF